MGLNVDSGRTVKGLWKGKLTLVARVHFSTWFNGCSGFRLVVGLSDLKRSFTAETIV